MKRQHEEGDLMDEETIPSAPKLKRTEQTCPYLGTVNRDRLDFDFEKVCSVSLSINNIYACLVCGKYFQGRGRNSHANIHSLQFGHHVFLNLTTKKYYCLPDDYEVIDSSLDDIKEMLDPQLTKKYIQTLDTVPVNTRTLEGLQHTAGVIGINNVKNNDYVNVTLQALGHLSLLRNFFLDSANNPLYPKSELGKRFSVFLRKMWCPRLYRNHVSPHELLQEISNRSNRQFKIGTRVNLVQFISWLLNTLHTGKRTRSSIIHECFQGEVYITSEKEEKTLINEHELEDGTEQPKYDSKIIQTSTTQPFLFLTLDCPPPPLFKDAKDKNFIPQEPLYTLLSKFDGVTKQYVAAEREYKTFLITELPKYLIFAINRFTRLEMQPYTNLPSDTTECTKYNLIANIRHNEGETAKEGFFNVHVLQKSTDKWFDIQDLMVEEALPPLIALSEAFIQIYERQDIF